MNDRLKFHFSTIIFNVLKSLKNIIWFIFLSLINSEALNPQFYLIIICIVIIISFIYNFLKWKSTYIILSDESLVYKTGIIKKKKLAIPLNKITTVDLEQNLFNRLFNTFRVRIDSGSLSKDDKDSELDLVFGKAQAEELQNYIAVRTAFEYKRVEDENNMSRYTASMKEFFIYGLTGSNVLRGLGAIASLYYLIEEIAGKSFIENILNEQIDKLTGLALTTLILFALVFIFLFIVISNIASIIITIIRFNNFSVERDGDTIRIEYGAIKLKKYTLNTRNIHAVILKQNMLRQIFKLCTLEVRSVGYGNEKDEIALLYPIADRKRVDELLKNVLPEFAHSALLQKPPAAALRMFFVKPVAMALILLAAASRLLPLKIAMICSVVIFPVSIIYGFLSYRNAGIAYDDKILEASRGAFNRQTTILRMPGIQSVATRSNYFQRKKKLCTYFFGYYGSGRWEVKVRNLHEKYFREICHRVVHY